jgi:hypothetical protein
MNELERVIAGLARPAPGNELDERIDRLLAERREPARRTWAWLALAAGVGGLGFFLGRQSVSVHPVQTAAVVPAAEPNPDRLVIVPLREQELAGVFSHAPAAEGLLGRGPIAVQVSTSH